jgi:hypothetical protein
MVGVTQVLPCVPDVLAVLPNRFKVSLECWKGINRLIFRRIQLLRG